MTSREKGVALGVLGIVLAIVSALLGVGVT